MSNYKARLSTVCVRHEIGLGCRADIAAIASEADAEIAALRLRVAELEAVQPSVLKEKLRSAESRIAELEKDAERYQWLRKGGYPIGDFTEEAIDDALAALNSKKE